MNRFHIGARAVQTFPLLVSLLAFPVAANGVYQVRGSVEQVWLKRDLSWGLTTNWFYVAVSNSSCIIRTGGMTDKAVKYFEYWSDGVNSTLLTQYLPASASTVAARPINGGLKLKTNSTPFDVLNNATLIINHGVVPEYSFGLITPVWIALASSSFYQSAASNHTDPVIFVGSGFRERNLKVEGRWHLADAPPHLPAWMYALCDGNSYHEEHDTLIKEQLSAPFNNSFTNVLYSVLSWTNVSDLVIPLEWRLIQLRPSSAGEFLETNIIARGLSERVSGVTLDQGFGMSIPPMTRVLDRTLPTRGIPIREYAYFSTNGELFTLQQMRKQLNFPLMLADAQQSAHASARRRAVFAASLIFLSFPLVVVFWRSRRGKPTP